MGTSHFSALSFKDVDGVGASTIRNANSFAINSVVTSGDSTANMGYDFSASFAGATGDSSLSNYGFQFWFQLFLGVPISWTNTAVPQKGTDHLVDVQLPQILALSPRPKLVLTRIGINDGSFTGDVSVANLTKFYNALKAAGIKWGVATVSPIESMTSSKARYSIIDKYIRNLAKNDPDNVKVEDINSLMANGSNVDGGAWDSASGFQVTYDGTHQNLTGALQQGKYMAHLYSPWFQVIAPVPISNGDDQNIIFNPGLGIGLTGGTSGVLATGGTGSIADNWGTSRSNAAISAHKVYRVFSVAQTLKVGDTARVGGRYKVSGVSGVHYICVTAGAAVVTLPSSTTLYADNVQPDAGTGPVFLVLPANDSDNRTRDPYRGHPYWSLYLECGNGAGGDPANTFLSLFQSITTKFTAGDRLQAMLYLEMLDTPWNGFALRLEGKDSGNAKVHDSHAPSYNLPNSNALEPNLRGLLASRDNFVVQPTETSFLFRFALYNFAGTQKVRCLVHHPAVVNLGPVTA